MYNNGIIKAIGSLPMAVDFFANIIVTTKQIYCKFIYKLKKIAKEERKSERTWRFFIKSQKV